MESEIEKIPITKTPKIEMEMEIAKPKIKELLITLDDDDETWKRKDEEFYNDGSRYMTSEEHDRYATQINESGGFEVDEFPNVLEMGMIQPMGIRTEATTFGAIAVQHYNDNIIEQGGEGVMLEFVKPLKINRQGVAGFIYFITFEAKNVGAPDDQSRVYQAKVWDGINVIEVFFFRLKDKPSEVFSFRLRETTGNSSESSSNGGLKND